MNENKGLNFFSRAKNFISKNGILDFQSVLVKLDLEIVFFYPNAFPNYVCASLPGSHQKGGGLFPIRSLDVEMQINIRNDIKARAHEATFMLWRGCTILKNFPIFWLNYNLNLCSYGQLLSLLKGSPCDL